KRANELGAEIVRRLDHYFKNTDQIALREVVEMLKCMASGGKGIKKLKRGEKAALAAKLQRLSEHDRRVFMNGLDSIIKETATTHGFKEDDARAVMR
ncbi:hypothetical protein PMAYCL1PPCAC_09451, partial [Pristionchus mayeri]